MIVLTSVLLAIFASGLALALSVLAVYFRDVSYLWAILIQVWFFATPIVYPPSLLEENAPDWAYSCCAQPDERLHRGVPQLSVRRGAPGWKTLLGLTVISFASLTIGWAIFNRMSRRLPEEV